MRDINIIWLGSVFSIIIYFLILLFFNFHLKISTLIKFIIPINFFIFIFFSFALISFLISVVVFNKIHIINKKQQERIRFALLRIGFAETIIILGFFTSLITGYIITIIPFIILFFIDLIIIKWDNEELIKNNYI